MMLALETRALQKTYPPAVQALRGMDVSVAAGEFFGLLGPNGAGKTTLIGIVAGLTNKSSGHVAVFGHDIDTDIHGAKSCIGLVPQEFNFNIFEKVIDIVVNQAGYYGIPRAAALPRAERYLQKLGLWEKRGVQARTLSGGMKRRLMIARALVHEPKLLILDEPTAGVDIELRRSMWDFLRELNAEGTTIILTTHYLEEAEQLCQQIAIINKGEIVAHGPVKALLGNLTSETFVFDATDTISKEQALLLKRFGVALLDARTLEMSLKEGESVTEAVQALDRVGIRVKSMRNKANRLEELFIHLTRETV